MGRVKLNQLGSCGFRAACRSRKSFNHGNNLSCAQSMGNLVAVVEGKCARSHDWRPATLLRRKRTASLPRFAGAGFSACMSKLYTRHGALLLDKGKHPAQRLYMTIAPDAKVHGPDAS